MENYAYFYNSDNGDRIYDADSMTDWLLPFFKTGVFQNHLKVTANDNMSISVGTGYCNINGKVKHFLNDTTFDIETASGTLNRIDNVILRRDDTQRDIYLMIQKGGNAQTPISPAVTRSGAIYDLKLAEIYISAGTIKITQAEITDKRMDANDCGWVAATVSELDFTQIANQFESFFDNYKKRAAVDYNNMLESMNEYKTQQEKVFELWFESIRGKLGEDAAGHLKNDIDELEIRIKKLIFNPKEYELTSNSWVQISTNLYEYSITVQGIKGTENITLCRVNDITSETTIANIKEYNKNFAFIVGGRTEKNKIVLVALKKPSINIRVGIKGV